MTEKDIRRKIISTCRYLVKNGLIARTWGNVSARLNDEEFIITPSGMSYDLMEPEDLVVCKISDCSYDKSQRKPSSEKKIHAAAYRYRPDVNFVIHTHQLYASAVCADESSITIGTNTFVPCIEYGLPSTSKLSKNCAKNFKNFPERNMFLMAKHGTICFGEDNKDAVDNAKYLEAECQTLFKRRVKTLMVPEYMPVFLDDYAQMAPFDNCDDLEAAQIVKKKNAAAMLYVRYAKPLGFFDTKIQHLIYKFKYSKLKDKK